MRDHIMGNDYDRTGYFFLQPSYDESQAHGDERHPVMNDKQVRGCQADGPDRFDPAEWIDRVDQGKDGDAFRAPAFLILSFAGEKNSRILQGEGNDGSLVTGLDKMLTECRIEIGNSSPQGKSRPDTDDVQNLQIYGFIYQVGIPVGGIPGDQFTQKAGQEQLGTNDHGGQCQVKIGALGHPCHRDGMYSIVDFLSP